jgi:hypothetical protein
MATTTLRTGARTTLTTSALNSLASGTYVSAGTIDVSATDPVDYLLEVEVTPGTVGGNKQVVVFAKVSNNNTNFTTGPETGTSTTDEANLKFIGTIPVNTNAAIQRNVWSIASALGFVPPFCKIVIKNDSGASLASSGHGVFYTPISAITE